MVLTLYKHNRGPSPLILRARTLGRHLSSLPTSQCPEDYFPAHFYEASLTFPAKFECSPAHIRPLPPLEIRRCLYSISLMSRHLLNTSLTWVSDLLLPDVYRVSIWTLFLGIDRSSSRIFIAFTGAAPTRSITVTFLSFNSGTQFKHGHPESCQMLWFGCAKLGYPLLHLVLSA